MWSESIETKRYKGNWQKQVMRNSYNIIRYIWIVLKNHLRLKANTICSRCVYLKQFRKCSLSIMLNRVGASRVPSNYLRILLHGFAPKPHHHWMRSKFWSDLLFLNVYFSHIWNRILLWMNIERQWFRSNRERDCGFRRNSLDG